MSMEGIHPLTSEDLSSFQPEWKGKYDKSEVEVQDDVLLFHPQAHTITSRRVGGWQHGYRTWVGDYIEDNSNHSYFLKELIRTHAHSLPQVAKLSPEERDQLGEQLARINNAEQTYTISDRIKNSRLGKWLGLSQKQTTEVQWLGETELLEEAFLYDLLKHVGMNAPEDILVEVQKLSGNNPNYEFYYATKMLTNYVDAKSVIDMGADYIDPAIADTVALNLGKCQPMLDIVEAHDGAERNILVSPQGEVYRIDLAGHHGERFKNISGAFNTYLSVKGIRDSFRCKLQNVKTNMGEVEQYVMIPEDLVRLSAEYDHFVRLFIQGYDEGSVLVKQKQPLLEQVLEEWKQMPGIASKIGKINSNLNEHLNGNLKKKFQEELLNFETKTKQGSLYSF